MATLELDGFFVVFFSDVFFFFGFSWMKKCARSSSFVILSTREPSMSPLATSSSKNEVVMVFSVRLVFAIWRAAIVSR